MTDQKTLAYINLYAVLGTLENLCELVPAARELVKTKKPISIAFDVKGGPNATIFFKNGRCRMEQGIAPCDVKLPFSSCEKFNGLIDGTVTPVPSKGFAHIGFLLKKFTPLTDMLSRYMRPQESDLQDPEFVEISTTLLFYTIAVALAQIGNNDPVGIFSAAHMLDGEINFAVQNGPAAAIRVKEHRLLTYKRRSEYPRASMQFASMELARALFDGRVNALSCIGEGSIEMKGMISMLDNLNRLLDRVALYLA